MAKKVKEAAPSPEVPAQPSLADALSELDARLKKQAEEEKRKLAKGYLASAQAKLKKYIAETTDDRLRLQFAEVRQLEKLVGSDDEVVAGGTGVNGGKRVRRAAEELKADAEKLVAFLKANPGSKASAAMQGTGVVVKPPLNVGTFIKKYLPSVKVKTTGERAGMTYSV